MTRCCSSRLPRYYGLLLLSGFFLSISSGMTGHAVAADLYVDHVNGLDSHDGASWEDAFATIGRGLAAAVNGDVVHVAAAVYEENLVLVAGVTLMGGYPAGGGDRDWLENETIIDGAGIDRCVFGAQDALLEGFILQNGYGVSGGGVQHDFISMTVRDCIIRNCLADGGNPEGGAGMHFINSDSCIEHCRFESNLLSIDPENVHTEVAGAGVLMWTSSPTFLNCEFIDNHNVDVTGTRVRIGGGAWCIVSSPIFRGCRFEGNSAMYGGGLGWWHETIPEVEDCVFIGNEADEGGGGVCAIYYNWGPQDTHFPIRDCVIQDNIAYTGGGVLALRNVKLRLDNCLITGNTAMEEGGGIFACIQADVIVENCTIAGNRSQHLDHGAGLFCCDESKFLLVDSIVAFNMGAEGIYYDGPFPFQNIIIDHCDFYENEMGDYCPEIVDRTGIMGNISADPLFFSGQDSDYYLSEPATADPDQSQLGRSPCIDAGLGTTNGTAARLRTVRTDLAKDSGVMDMGYHHFRKGPYVLARNPGLDAAGVPVDTPLELYVRDRTAAIDPDSIAIMVNGVTQDIELMPDYLGYYITCAPAGYSPCEEVEVVVEATDLADPPVSMIGYEYWFTTEGCTPTPVPSPTPPPPAGPPGVELLCGEDAFAAGEVMHMRYLLSNPNFTPVLFDLHIALEAYGEFYFFPYWDADLHPLLTRLGAGAHQEHDLLYVQLPADLEPAGPFTMYAVLTLPETFEVTGEIALFEFEFE
ncbi:right-handed parallel beta-helix repeat-containing protein [bacterium]|nr:right-handed parallel beta-helix repeat-containing protein [candidate division CSSED10-310 bacterium]